MAWSIAHELEHGTHEAIIEPDVGLAGLLQFNDFGSDLWSLFVEDGNTGIGENVSSLSEEGRRSGRRGNSGFTLIRFELGDTVGISFEGFIRLHSGLYGV